jgi:hypothetical protein
VGSRASLDAVVKIKNFTAPVGNRTVVQTVALTELSRLLGSDVRVIEYPGSTASLLVIRVLLWRC